jgi:hypothetical protein
MDITRFSNMGISIVCLNESNLMQHLGGWFSRRRTDDLYLPTHPFRPDLPSSIKYGSKWQSELISGLFTFEPGPGNGLIGALLTPCFQIPGIWVQNQKSLILRGEKPAYLFPLGGKTPLLCAEV